MKLRQRFLLILVAVFLFSSPACELIDDDPFADLRDNLVGTWRFDESELKSTLAFYNVTISKDPGNSSQVLVRNFGNISRFVDVYGIVTKNRIEIPEQNVLTVKVQGIGNLTSNRFMNWTYTTNDGADEKSYSAVAEKL